MYIVYGSLDTLALWLDLFQMINMKQCRLIMYHWVFIDFFETRTGSDLGDKVSLPLSIFGAQKYRIHSQR